MERVTGKEPGFSFTRTYALPALLLFVIPVFSFWFFRHVQSHYDRQVTASLEQAIGQDAALSAEQRAGLQAFFRQIPPSRILATSDRRFEDWKEGLPARLRFEYASFRWMIRLSLIGIGSAVCAFVAAGLSVAYSLRSQLAQYYSLSVGWHVLRAFATVQVLLQGCLVVALSYWVTAFCFEAYYPKIIGVAALLALAAAAAVIRAIFTRIDETFEVEGIVIDRGAHTRLWADLDRICGAVGTPPPDRVVAGIDDNFFVTEHAVTVNGMKYEGRTLFVSLSLLRVLEGVEADAVMAHEMAHFSGNDTLYSKRISPLLNRYGLYLQALAASPIALPVFWFMQCFRGLFEISLRRLGRQREFRADRIAADTTSAEAIARALLKIAAYATYRAQVEEDLFSAERRHDTLDVAGRVQAGFRDFAVAFVGGGRYRGLQTAHPFDSHPPTDKRLQAVGMQLAPDDVLTVLQGQADRRWYLNIDGAQDLETRQWSAFEERFRKFHERMLAYRYRPETDEERQIVLTHFPGVAFPDRKSGVLSIDYEKITYTPWPDPLRFDEISRCQGEQSALGHPQIRFDSTRAGKRVLRLDVFSAGQQVVADALNQYYSRYLAMTQYRSEKAAERRPE